MSVIKGGEDKAPDFSTVAGVNYLAVGRYWCIVHEKTWAAFDGWVSSNANFVSLLVDESHLGGIVLPSPVDLVRGEGRYRFIVFAVQFPNLVQWLFRSIALHQATDSVASINDVIDFEKTKPFGADGPSGQAVLDVLGNPKSPLDFASGLLKTVAIVAAVGVGVYALSQVATIASLFKRR